VKQLFSDTLIHESINFVQKIERHYRNWDEMFFNPEKDEQFLSFFKQNTGLRNLPKTWLNSKNPKTDFKTSKINGFNFISSKNYSYEC
jgi:hypothetical protein